MSYTLLFQICSMLYGSCMATMSDGITYTDFASCVLEGSRVTSKVIITLTPEEINMNELYVQFACVKKPDIKL